MAMMGGARRDNGLADAMRTPAPRCSKRRFSQLSLLLLIGVLTACGSRQPDLEPPSVGFLELNANTGEASLRLSNPVAAPLPTSGQVLSITLDGRNLGTFRPALDLTIPPLGSERLRIQIPSGHAALAALSDRPARYHITGTVFVTGQRSLEIDSEGWLSPTPGRNGSYR